MRSGLKKKFFTRTFYTFDCTEKNETAFNVCLDIVEGRRTKGVIISGPQGIGKTHLSAAIVNRYAEKGRKATFSNYVRFVKKVQGSFKTGTEPVIEALLDAEVAVIDDLGAEEVKEDSRAWHDNLLYDVLNSAYEAEIIIIITTNLSDQNFAMRYNPRIVSRLHEMCDWVEYSERDRRTDMIETNEKMPFEVGV